MTSQTIGALILISIYVENGGYKIVYFYTDLVGLRQLLLSNQVYVQRFHQTVEVV